MTPPLYATFSRIGACLLVAALCGCSVLKGGSSRASLDAGAAADAADKAAPSVRALGKPAAPAKVSAAAETGKVVQVAAVAAQPKPAVEDLPSPSAYVYRLRPGDPVVIFLRGIFPKDDQVEDVIDEQGYINLPYLDAIKASDKTTTQLESEIQRAYITRQIYKNINVNVVMPSQSYFVRGELKAPGRYALVTGVKLLQVIAGSGGYTEFADRTRIKIIRGDKVLVFNAKEIEKAPEQDVQIEPGDVIVVERKIF